jgi:endoglucanase
MQALDPDELTRLDHAIAGLDGFKLVILDLHIYARYRCAVLDPSDGSDRMLVDLWRRLALHFRGSPEVAFDVMNEPFGVEAEKWRLIVDRTVAAIRSTGPAVFS